MRSFASFGDEGPLYHRFLSDPGSVIAFYDTLNRSVHLEPEKRLMLALLDDALKCYQKYWRAKSRRGKTQFDEAQQWFWASDREDLFSFEHVCAVLGVSPGYLRRLLLRWHAAAQSEGSLDGGGATGERPARKRFRYAA